MSWSAGMLFDYSTCHSVLFTYMNSSAVIYSQVRRSDDSSKTCQQCFDKVNKFLRFRESYVARRNSQLLRNRPTAISVRRPSDINAISIFAGGVDMAASDGGHSPDVFENLLSDQAAPVMCITVTDTESEDEQSESQNDLSVESARIISDESQTKNAASRCNDDKFSIKCSMGWCTNYFESVAAMAYHVQIYHAKGIKNSFECHLCKKLSPTKPMHQRHMNCLHVGRKSFQCSIRGCSIKFARKDHLVAHNVSVHSKSVYHCDMCEKSFRCMFALRGHLKRMHNNQSKFECPLLSCPKQFSRRANLKEHVLCDHQAFFGIQRTFCCYICNYTCLKQLSLRLHMKNMHIKGKCLTCPISKCLKKFYFACELKKHLAGSHSHGDGPAHQCDLCKKSFSTRQSLQQHMSLHGVPKRFKCLRPMCSATYHQKSKLDRHAEKMHHDTPTLSCPVCQKPLEDPKSLDSHMKLAHSGRMPICRLCDRIFFSHNNLERHIRDAHCDKSKGDQAEPIMCVTITDTESEDENVYINLPQSNNPKGGVSVRSAQMKSNHAFTKQKLAIAKKGQSEMGVDRETDKFPVKCMRRCVMNSFESLNAMYYHVEIFHAKGIKNTFECHLCKFKITSKFKSNFYRHMRSVHFGSESFQCPIQGCSRKFALKAYIKPHIDMVHSKNPRFCGLCGNSFKCIRLLRRHVKQVHNEQSRFKCQVASCSKAFPRRYILKEHAINEHRDTLGMHCTFRCHLCNKPCLSLSLLKAHMTHQHIKGKRFKCPIPKCLKKYYNKNLLKRHLAYKHNKGGGLVYQCDICKKILSSNQALQWHKSVHGAEKCFKCPKAKCLAAYNRKYDLDTHMTRKHGEPIIFCPICRESMDSKQSLNSHMKLRHGSRLPSRRV